MTVNELLARLMKLKAEGHGDADVLIHYAPDSGYEIIHQVGTEHVFHNDNKKYCSAEYVKRDMLESDRLGHVYEGTAVTIYHGGV